MAVITDIMKSSEEVFSARRVFGDPIEKDGLTVIPVAMVAGGGGGGSQLTEEEGKPEGEGGGFGGVARPAGAYVVRADSVEWHPALDVTLIALAGMALTALITLTVGRLLRRVL